MSWLKKLFGGSRAQLAPVKDTSSCPHTKLAPMWESVHEMGEFDKISRYRCLDCGRYIPVAAVPSTARQDAA